MECVVCKNKNVEVSDLNKQMLKDIECPLCGYYQISRDAVDDRIIDSISTDDQALFSGFLRNHTSRKNPMRFPHHERQTP